MNALGSAGGGGSVEPGGGSSALLAYWPSYTPRMSPLEEVWLMGAKEAFQHSLKDEIGRHLMQLETILEISRHE